MSADGISGERERGRETCSCTISRRSIIAGKLIAALSLWFGTFLVSIPYVWVLARGVGILGRALALGLCVGTLVALGLGAIGLLISAACNSNKTSIAASIFLLLILFAPTQLPSGLPQGWFFDVLLRANPVASGLAYISSILVEGHSWTQDLSLLITPLLTAIIAGGALVFAGPRLVRPRGVMPDEKVALDWADGRRTDLAPGSCSRGDSAKREGGRRAGSGQDPARRPVHDHH